jgi:hypothetical protein
MADRESHARKVRLLAKAGSASAAAAALDWIAACPDDREALLTAAPLVGAAGLPEAGALYVRAAEAAPDDLGRVLDALVWLADHHVHLDRLDGLVASAARLVASTSPAGRQFAALGALRAGRPETALGFVAGVAELAPLARLIGWLLEARQVAETATPAGTDTVLHAAIWGSAHAAVFAEMVLPALLHATNLPAFLAGRRAATLVYCDRAARDVLAAAPATRSLAALAELRFIDLPAETVAGNPFVNVLGAAQHAGLHAAATRHADALFLHADGIYSAGSLAHVAARVADGCEMFCAIGPSAVLEDAAPTLIAARGRDGTIAIDGTRLAATAFANLHERARAMVVRADDATRPSNPALLLFREPGRLRMRAFQPGPTYVARRLLAADTRFNYCVSDNGVMNRLATLAAPPPRIEFGADAARFCLVDLAPAGPASVRTTRAPAGGDLAGAIFASACRWNMVDPYRLAAFEAESVWPDPGGGNDAPACDALIAAIADRARDFLARQDAAFTAAGIRRGS